MELEEFEQYKNSLKEKVKKEGFIEVQDLRGQGLDSKQLQEILDWLETDDVETITEWEAYLRRLPTTRARIQFCYFVFVSKVFGDEIIIKNFKRYLCSRYKPIVDYYINYVAKGAIVKFVRTKFGLDTGEICFDNDKLFKKLEYPYWDMFIHNLEAANEILSPGFEELEYLKFQLSEVEKLVRLEKYICNEVTFSEDDKGIMFQPMTVENKKETGYVGPFAVYYPEDNSRQIGWVSEPYQVGQSLTFYDNDVWGIRFYNKNRPSPHIHYENGKLYFELYYSGVGYHGRRYVIENGKNVIIEEWKKGTKVSETEIDFKVEANFRNMFVFDKFEKDDTTSGILTNGDLVYKTVNTHNGLRLVCRVGKETANSVLGHISEKGFEGTVLRHRAYDDSFTYQNYSKGEVVSAAPILKVDKASFPQRLSLTFFKGVTGKKCIFIYDCSDSFDELLYAEYNSESKEPENIANLSNPFFRKPIVKEMKVDENDDPEEALNKLIGLESVKKQITRLKALLHKDRNKNNPINLNMVFCGNPGTGKTIVARLLAGILFKEKILPTSKFVEVDRSMIVAKYEGQTENKVKELIESAMGGVLFIDEAYSLYSRWGEEGNDFGRNALDTFVKAMEDYRGKICFIFAGYKQPMAKMMDLNQGFKSRVNRNIDFPNYSLDELKLIALKMVSDNGYTLEDGVVDEILKIVEPHMEDRDFANAREVRNILETLYEIQAVRTYEDTKDMLIKMDDIKSYEEDIHFKSASEKAKSSVRLEDIIEQQNKLVDIEITDRYIQEASVNIKLYNKEDVLLGEGSGFFITADGLVGTCAHVVKEAEAVKVNVNIFTNKGKRVSKLYDAVVVGFDEKSDVGLVKIIEPDIDFTYYKIANRDVKIDLLAPVAMGGYPLGAERFKTISINEGKVQALNKDELIDEDEETKIDRIYVDLTGHSGNSGSGLIARQLNQCIGVYAGGSLGYSGPVVIKMNYAIHIKYLWDLIERLDKENTKE